MSDQQLLTVRIVSPKQDLFTGQVSSVSSVNSVGPFDILWSHAKFVTLVENKPLILRFPDGQKKEFTFNLAIIHAHDNQVDVYTNPLEAGQDLTKIA